MTRNRSKIRLRNKRNKRTGAIVSDLRRQVVEAKKSEAEIRKELNYREVMERAQKQRRVSERMNVGNPPKPYKTWYEVFTQAKDVIYAGGVGERVQFYDSGRTRDYSASASVQVHTMSVDQILFGTINELENTITPIEFVDIIRREIYESRLLPNEKGEIMVAGKPYNLNLAMDLALAQRYRD